MPEQHWIAVNGRLGHSKELHTDESCPKLQRAASAKETDREKHPNKTVCDVCSGAWTAHEDDGETYECDECPAEYETVGGLGRHVMREHPEVVEERLTTDQRKVPA